MADSRVTLHEHEWYYGEIRYTAKRVEPESVYGVIEPQAFKESAAVNEILYLAQREEELTSELEKWQQKAFRRVEPERLTEERIACAELVRAAGCSCRTAIGRWTFGADREIAIARLASGDHSFDPRCPIALALAIEARGKE